MTVGQSNSVRLAVGDLFFELIRDPRNSIRQDRLKKLSDDCVAVTRDGFGSPEIPASDAILHAIDVHYGAYVFNGEDCRVFSSAELLDLESGPMIYMAGSVVHSELQGRGLYQPLIVLRLAVGTVLGAASWGTRTQSPRVAQAFYRFGAYPFRTNNAELDQSRAAELAGVLYHPERSDFLRRGGLLFDKETSVMREAYERPMYGSLPDSSVPEVGQFFLDFVRIPENAPGDAAVLVGDMSMARPAADLLSDRHFRMSFSDLVDTIRPVVEA